ncbi:HAMP domain-containing sensor histidine kinase [Roseovarius sp. MBR-6]|jgi:signal transduction histidine kinase|uniref:sensor histidine kinase n=1 Tax=Roseovarius sp. MBR-6 TaxID=3156459 RepID=UPI00339410EA
MAETRRISGLLHLLRSSPVRLAVGLVILFALVNLLSLGLAWLKIRGNVEAQIAANLDQQIAGFRVTRDPRTLATLVEAEAAAVDPANRILVFVSPGGVSYGNAIAEIRGREISLSQREEGRALSKVGYEYRTRAMAQGLLVVAESRRALRETEEIFVAVLIFSILPTVLISLGVGTWIAIASARRVGRIESALRLLEEGNFAARVAEQGRRDDLARIGAGIDRMAQAQEAAISALRQVSADIAHDLKTPIQRISVILADLGERLADGSTEAEMAARAAAEAERAAAVFQSLLLIAQLEGGGGKSQFREVDLAEVLRTMTEIYAPSAEDSGHILVLEDLPDRPVRVHGDRGLIGQLVANLIENGLRHTPPGSRITLALEGTPREALVTVSDTGPGIPEAERAPVFRRLYRLEGSRTTPGNGLGLSLVQAIADLHGAHLSLGDNHPGLRVAIRFVIARP